MEFKDIIAVSGIAGLKKIIANRNDGLILSELDDSNKKFYSNRQHMFSPLENIAIYTDEDTVPLLDVMINGASEVIESELIIQFRSMQAIDQYHRIQPDLIGDSQEMDDASPENIQRLMEISATTIEKYKDELEVIVNRLINN